MSDYFSTARVTNTYRATHPRSAKLARIHPGLVKVRRYQDDSGQIKKTIELEVPMHNHETKRDKDTPFNHCVNPHNCNPAAHGNITSLETCSCGATRKVNINGAHLEYGHWEAPEK